MPRKKTTPTLSAQYNLPPDFARARAAVAEDCAVQHSKVDADGAARYAVIDEHERQWIEINKRYAGDAAADRHEEAAAQDHPVRPVLADAPKPWPQPVDNPKLRKPTPSRAVPSGRPYTLDEDERILAGAFADDVVLVGELGRGPGVTGIRKRRTILRNRQISAGTSAATASGNVTVTALDEPEHKEPSSGALPPAGATGQIGDVAYSDPAGRASGPVPTRPADPGSVALGNDEGSPALPTENGGPIKGLNKPCGKRLFFAGGPGEPYACEKQECLEAEMCMHPVSAPESVAMSDVPNQMTGCPRPDCDDTSQSACAADDCPNGNMRVADTPSSSTEVGAADSCQDGPIGAEHPGTGANTLSAAPAPGALPLAGAVEDISGGKRPTNPRTPWRSYGTFTRSSKVPPQHAAPISRDAELEEIERVVAAKQQSSNAYRPPAQPAFERVAIPQADAPRPPRRAAATSAAWEPIRQLTDEEKMRGRAMPRTDEADNYHHQEKDDEPT